MAQSLLTSIQKSGTSLLQLNRELDSLCRAGQVINSSLDLEKVLTALIKEVRVLMGAAGSSVWLTSSNEKEVVCLQATGKKSSLVRGWRLPIGKGVVGWIAKNGKNVLIKDTRNDQRHCKDVDNKTAMEIRSMIGVPLRSKKRIVGVLQSVDTTAGYFNRHQLKLMCGLAASAGVAITNAILFEEAQQEIDVRKKAAKLLRKRERDLRVKSQNLEELNSALQVLTQKRGEERKQIEEQILMNARTLIDPYLKKLYQSGLNREQTELLEILEGNFKEIVSPFTYRISMDHLGITKRELDIANLIRQGRRNHEIAKFLGITRRTVETHRRNLRVKLGIDNQKVNLRVHLMTTLAENT